MLRVLGYIQHYSPPLRGIVVYYSWNWTNAHVGCLEEQRNTSTALESQVFYASARPRGDELFYYGVDGEQDLDSGEEEAVVVPETVLSLSDQQINHLHSLFPTNLDRVDNIEKYAQVVDTVQGMLSTGN